MNGKSNGPIRSFLAGTAFVAIWMNGAPATATPLASLFFGPDDFRASLEVVVQTVPGSLTSIEEQGVSARASLIREEGIGPLGSRGSVLAKAGGEAGLHLQASGGTEVEVQSASDTGEEVLALGEVRAGVVNKFLAVPRSGFSGTDAVFRFEVLTSGLLFADLFDSSAASYAGSASVVAAGVGFVVPGCPGCISDYGFEDFVSLGSDRHSVADRRTIVGRIPVGVPVTVEAGLTIVTQILAGVSPDGSLWGNTGAYFGDTLRFGVSSPDEVDFVWASDLFYDRQPSVSDPASIPEPSSLVLVAGLLAALGVRRAARSRRARTHA